MKLAFNTLGTPDWSLEQIAEAAMLYGYDGVELRLVDGEVITAESLRRNAKRLEQLFTCGVTQVVALATGIQLSTGDPDVRRRNQVQGAEMIDIAASLGTPLVRVFGGKRPEGVGVKEGIRNTVEGLRDLAVVAERAGVVVMLETHDDFCSSRVVREIADQVPSRAFGVHWDIQNTFKVGESPNHSWELLGGRVVHIHVKDARRGAEPWPRVLLGDGDVPVQESVALLRDAGYAGYLSVEIERKWHRELPAPEVALPQYARKLRTWIGKSNVPAGC